MGKIPTVELPRASISYRGLGTSKMGWKSCGSQTLTTEPWSSQNSPLPHSLTHILGNSRFDKLLVSSFWPKANWTLQWGWRSHNVSGLGGHLDTEGKPQSSESRIRKQVSQLRAQHTSAMPLTLVSKERDSLPSTPIPSQLFLIIKKGKPCKERLNPFWWWQTPSISWMETVSLCLTRRNYLGKVTGVVTQLHYSPSHSLPSLPASAGAWGASCGR